MKKVHIVIMDGYPAFKEIALSTKYSLELLGFEVELNLTLKLYSDVINIIFAAHHLCLNDFKNQNIKLENVIIYNLEQVGTSVPWMNAKYFHIMRNAHIWEYSTDNLIKLNQFGINNTALVPIGYTPNLEVIPRLDKKNKDIDIFFYGSASDRRLKAIEQIKATGLNVVSTTDIGQIMDDARDNLIARSKIILNMHYYEDAHIFEIVRVSYLLANHKAVVSELGEHTSIDADIKNAICHGSIHDIPSICLDLIKNPQKLEKLENAGYKAIKQRDATKYIQKGMEKYLSSKNSIFSIPTQINNNACALPTDINLGCGLDWKYNMFNIDYDAKFKPDLILDINNINDLSKEQNIWRFGNHGNLNGYFSNIHAIHVFECIDNMKNAMTNCLNLLKEGGDLHIRTIHDLSMNAWSSPEYKRHFNEGSFLYYCNSMNLFNLDWHEYAFDFVEYHISLSDYGLNLYYSNNNNYDTIKYTPRVIDFINFKLRKRILRDDEKTLLKMQQTI